MVSITTQKQSNLEICISWLPQSKHALQTMVDIRKKRRSTLGSGLNPQMVSTWYVFPIFNYRSNSAVYFLGYLFLFNFWFPQPSTLSTSTKSVAQCFGAAEENIGMKRKLFEDDYKQAFDFSASVSKLSSPRKVVSPRLRKTKLPLVSGR